MNVSEIKFFEKHVEKIVLGVAACGALYLGYLAMQPITIPEDPNNPAGAQIAVADVDKEVEREVMKLKDLREKNAQLVREQMAKPEAQAEIRDPRDRYRTLIGKEPLQVALLNLPESDFGPRNSSVQKGLDTGGATPTYDVVIPNAPDPMAVTLEAFRNTVADAQPAMMGPGGVPIPVVAPVPGGVGGPMLKMHDQNAVRVQGYVPMGRFMFELTDPRLANNQRLPVQNQKTVIYRIEVQRRERAAGKEWGAWTPVTPTRAVVPAPTDVPWQALAGPDAVTAAITQVDQEFKLIVLPDFYTDSQGIPFAPTIVTRDMPAEVKAAQTKLQKDTEDANKAAGIVGPRVGIGPGMTLPPGIPPGAVPIPGMTGAVPIPGAVTPVPGQPAAPIDVTPFKTQEFIPFCFWDETVLPDHEYQYQVRAVVTNPGFGWQWGLKNKALQSQPVLASNWVMAGGIGIQPDVVFFVMGSGSLGAGAGKKERVSIRVYKYTEGKWYMDNWDTEPGGPVAGRIALVDQNTSIDVDTHYTVVDVVPSKDGRDNTLVVLSDPKGNLVPRDSNLDRINSDNQKLFEIRQTLVPVATTAPGMTGVPTTGPRNQPPQFPTTGPHNPPPQFPTTGPRGGGVLPPDPRLPRGGRAG